MKKVEVKLRILTPMFSYGADNRESEFRITELKALLRATFRELYYFENHEKIRELEEELFGSITKKSPVAFRITQRPIKYEMKEYLLPHKIGKKRMSPMSCIKPGAEISLYMMEKYSKGEDNKNYLNLYIDLLIQASIIGSLGKRCRKGFGSFIIEDINDLTNKENNIKYRKLLEKEPLEILKMIKSDDNRFKLRYRIIKADAIEYDFTKDYLRYPYVKSVKILPIDREVKHILKDISQLTHDRLILDKDNPKSLLYRKTSQKPDTNILGKHKKWEHVINRFPSPIYISFTESAGKNYMVIKELNYNYLEIGNERENYEYIKAFIERLEKISKERDR